MSSIPTVVSAPVALILTDKSFTEEHIYVRWTYPRIYDQILVLYKRTEQKGLFSTRYVYEAIELEYIPTFVGIELGCYSSTDYEFKMFKSLEQRNIKAVYSNGSDKFKQYKFYGNFKYNLETHKQSRINVDNDEYALNLYNHWLSN